MIRTRSSTQRFLKLMLCSCAVYLAPPSTASAFFSIRPATRFQILIRHTGSVSPLLARNQTPLRLASANQQTPRGSGTRQGPRTFSSSPSPSHTAKHPLGTGVETDNVFSEKDRVFLRNLQVEMLEGLVFGASACASLFHFFKS